MSKQSAESLPDHWYDFRPPQSVEICLAADFLEGGNPLDNPADDELVQLCGSCGHRLKAFHSKYDGEPDSFMEVYCPNCFNVCFRHTTVIVTRRLAKNHSKEYVQEYILNRFNQRAWKGDIADIETEVPQVMVDDLPEPTYVAKQPLEQAEIEWQLRCPVCGVEEGEATFDFHHWDYEEDKGCRVCRECHNAIHGGERAREQAASTGREWEYDAVKRLHQRATESGLNIEDEFVFRRRFNIRGNADAYRAVDEVLSSSD